MIHFFTKKRLFLVLFFSIGIAFSCFLASTLNKKFLKYEEILMQIELERKVLFLKKSIASEETALHHCLFNSTSSKDTCTQIFTLHEGLWLYDMRIFRNDTLMFEKNINPEIAWGTWTKGQELELKNSVFVFEMKPTQEHLEFLKSDSPKVIFWLGVFLSFVFTALLWFYQLLFAKKEELRKAKNEIFAANATLQKKNIELEEYAYVVAHDLQEPLNTINGFVEVLREDHEVIFENKEIEQHFALISNASSRMRVMIKELLQYTKLGKNRQPELVNISEIVDETLIDLSYLIKKSGATINLPKKFPTIKGYRLELKLLFQNLIINAVKYQKSDTKPIVDIFFKSNSLEKRFTIQDNGIGIEEKYQNTIFKLFHRLHNSNKYSGSGIGLTKCKKILDLHNGTIWVESSPQKGSKFHFTIPNLDLQIKL